MVRTTVAFVVSATVVFPAIAQEAPIYAGDYNPPVVRSGHDTRRAELDYSATRAIGGLHENLDPRPQGYSANVSLMDLRSGR